MENFNFREIKKIYIGRYFIEFLYLLVIYIYEMSFIFVLYDF